MGTRFTIVITAALSLSLWACSGSDAGSAATDTAGAQFGDASSSDDGETTSSDVVDAPEPGSCEGQSVGALCDDTDCCTVGDSCQACDADSDADCLAGGLKCVGNPACVDEDDNVCTVTECSCDDESAPVCTDANAPDGDPCDFDTNDCTLGDTCLGGACIKADPLPLDDGNPCTEDSCVKGELVHAPLLEGQCDDGDECTSNDVCVLGTCTGGDPVECVVGPCMAAAECVPGEGCVESPLPVGAFCGTDNSCIVSAACDAEANCEVVEHKNCDDGNPCTTDSCDPASGCIHDADATEAEACALDTEEDCVAGGICTSGMCVAQPTLTCDPGDGCCAEGCDATIDSDCSASCGNEVVEGTEKCDGDCPTDCEGADPCQYGVLVGDPALCSAQCSFIEITQCIEDDGCCPAGCANENDHDCAALCGNGVVDAGELCDGDCPTSCQSDGACGTPDLVGSAANCDAQCVDVIASCQSGDGCCPDGCTATNDDDCETVLPCHVNFDVQCVEDPVMPVRYKITVIASPGVMNYYWNPTPVADPQIQSFVQGGWCWNDTGDYMPFSEPAGCFDVVYDTITEEADCSNNGPPSSCAAQFCYDCN